MNEATLPFHPDRGEQLARRTRVAGRGERNHVPYDYTDDIVVAVNAALSTDRPLLLRGEPGCGKSSMARDVAIALDRDFDDKVITSRTTATDLLWTFDAVHRLSDTTALPDKARDPGNYVKPGILWRAFSPDAGHATGRDMVVLIDEIDKADPDVPNDLLVTLGEGRFTVTDAESPVEVTRRRSVLVIITTNGERELPPAFLRRCVSVTLDDPSKDGKRLEAIARRHLAAAARDGNQAEPELDKKVLAGIVARVKMLADGLGPMGRRPGTAEILDALKAAVALGIGPDSDDWLRLTRVLLYKESGNPDAAASLEDAE